MRVLLFNRETRLFYSKGGEWVPDRERAHDFRHSAQPILMASEMNLKGAEILYDFSDPQYDLILPIRSH
jgi:hypothetical protein